MAAGYRIDEPTSQRAIEAVWLKHPAVRRVPAPSIVLHDDGRVASGNLQGAAVWITPEDDAAFSAFLSQVPQATLWEKSAEWRYSMLAWMFFLSIAACVWMMTDILFAFFGLRR